jgi:hypothetical protein
MSQEPQASKKELRSFGLLVGGVFGAIGIWPFLLRGQPAKIWALGLGGLLILLGGVLPSMLAPLHRGWMWIGHILGWVNTRILLGLVFYGLITPMGILFRLMGKDVMRRAFAQDSPTYRVIKQPRPRGHMKFQF